MRFYRNGLQFLPTIFTSTPIIESLYGQFAVLIITTTNNPTYPLCSVAKRKSIALALALVLSRFAITMSPVPWISSPTSPDQVPLSITEPHCLSAAGCQEHLRFHFKSIYICKIIVNINVIFQGIVLDLFLVYSLYCQ